MGKILDAVESAGGCTAVARACGMSKTGVSKWCSKNKMPYTEFFGKEPTYSKIISKMSGKYTEQELMEVGRDAIAWEAGYTPANLGRLMSHNGITISGAAKALGVRREKVRAWMNGNEDMPSKAFKKLMRFK